MALADTIHDLLTQQKIQSTNDSDKSVLLADWQRDVTEVLARIQATIQPFIADGSAVAVSGTVKIDEDLLGTYEAPQLAFTIANRRIIAAPVARVTFGGTGRIDLYRADRPSERDRFLIVREAGEAETASLAWLMENKDEVPPDALLPLRSIRRSSRRFYPFSQAVIESAIDYLLRMR